MSRQKTIDELLHEHKFVLVAQRKHLKYRDPEGRIFVMAATPSDWRAGIKALKTFEKVVEAPPPSNELVEEIRQAKELEATITLEPCPKTKPSLGHASKKKSTGTGYVYIDKEVVELTPEQKEQQRRDAEFGVEWAKLLEEERKAKRQVRRQAEAWDRLIAHVKQDLEDHSDALREITRVLNTCIGVGQARAVLARKLKQSYRDREAYRAESHRERLLTLGAEYLELAHETDGHFVTPEELSGIVETVGFYMYDISDKPPLKWWPPPRFRTVHVTPMFIRVLRSLEEVLPDWKDEPRWLREAVATLEAGVNRTRNESEYWNWAWGKMTNEPNPNFVPAKSFHTMGVDTGELIRRGLLPAARAEVRVNWQSRKATVVLLTTDRTEDFPAMEYEIPPGVDTVADVGREITTNAIFEGILQQESLVTIGEEDGESERPPDTVQVVQS
jgi:hypothetical protein